MAEDFELTPGSISPIVDRLRVIAGEEQERELGAEIEQERQAQRLAQAKILPHILHLDIVQFVATGVPLAHSQACQLAFAALLDTAAGQCIDVT